MENQTIIWPAPAKLNLFLHITGRRANGYHELQSLFQLLDVGDELTFTIKDSSEIKLLTPIQGVPDEQNLIVRAAKALQQASNCKQGADIILNKKLPMGGGIGGGSSNAATTLVALNYMWQLNLPLEKLAHIGLSLGADVPIFVQGQTAFAQGVGEKLFPVSLKQHFYVVVTPDCHISTAEIFQHPDLPRDTATLDFNNYQFKQTQNDCQQLVFSRYPIVAKAFDWLIEYAPSRMTGTGASVFAMFEDEASARRCLAELPSFLSGFMAKGVNKSPVHSLLESLNIG
ncbi:4-(cytidine 5'-diphospho)-2-C-methyl-D-erythritol kinase [Neptunicella marina]|uniref:4-diphosphocytidyl-2-C-methyl-D-erythritol kinase n=1 Tax=Neptunicella marina TaxID=2125989 RepID=A0A8J6IRP7_9ALTE|nr:4-(cytidine 5'-diphospho)-2-C-methyl-D-erythritol kinase [Neptunicella marina]MBC3764366.1 4-(cytidine 5'-diphospho)-2-C-methyl-D-erythritol kinase [Neptunicella marina]